MTLVLTNYSSYISRFGITVQDNGQLCCKIKTSRPRPKCLDGKLASIMSTLSSSDNVIATKSPWKLVIFKVNSRLQIFLG